MLPRVRRLTRGYTPSSLRDSHSFVASRQPYVVSLLDRILFNKRNLERLRMAKGFLTYSTAVILQAVASGYSYGFDIIDATGVPGGTVYPALRRLEDAGCLTSKWEEQDIAQNEPRPARRYYELTRAGRDALGEALKRYRLLEQTRPNKQRRPKASRV